MRVTHSALLLAVTAIGMGNVLAVGFRMPNQDPLGIARGNAFVATADNPAAIYYNPAGITQLEGHHLSTGLYFISTDVDFTSVASTTGSTETDVQAVPQLHYVYSPPESPLSFGLGIYAPYGLGIDWGENSPLATLGREAMLAYATVNPVVAYQVNDSLSISGGLTLNYSHCSLEQSLYPVGTPGGRGNFKFSGDDFQVGFNAGLLWQPHEQWSFGISYRSETNMDYSGDSEVKDHIGLAGGNATSDSTSVGLTFPQYVDFGISYRPTPEWNFEVNMDWTDFDPVNTPIMAGTPLGNVPFPLEYESSWMYEFGVTRYLDDGYWVSAGYIYSENSVPDTTLNPLNPDSDLHLGSIGFGKRGDIWSWALGYHFAYNGGRTISGNAPNTAGESTNGKFDTLNHAVNFTVRRSF